MRVKQSPQFRISWMHNNSYFSGIGVIPPIRDAAFKRLKKSLQVIERTHCPSTVNLPGLCEVRIHRFQAFDQRKDSNNVGNHSQWVPLHHYPPNMKNIGHPITVSHDEQGMVTIEVKKK